MANILEKLMSAAPIVLAAPIAGAYSGTVTIRCSESGILDLTRLMLNVYQTGNGQAPQPAPMDLGFLTRVSGIRFNGSTIMLRGRSIGAVGQEDPRAPANIWSVKRIKNRLALPKFRVKSGNTVSIDWTLAATWVAAGPPDLVVSASAPLIADDLCDRNEPTIPNAREVLTASPRVSIAAGATVVVQVGFDNDGVADLNRIMWGVDLLSTAGGDSTYGTTDAGAYFTEVSAANLRREYDMIVGDPDPATALPAACAGGFLHPFRAMNFVRFGRHKVSSGDRFSLTITNRMESVAATTPIEVYVGIPTFVTGDGKISQDCA